MIDENTFYDEEYYEKDDEKKSSKYPQTWAGALYKLTLSLYKLI